MISDVIVYVSIWVAVLLWFAGALARSWDRTSASHRAYGFSWFLGALFICVHIAASYGWVYYWSHSAALQATADESHRVTGIRAAWGVYVNFAFAIIWLAYAIRLVLVGRARPMIDSAIFWFTAAIMFAANIIFESGVLRVLVTAGFVIVGLVTLAARRRVRNAPIQ